MKESKEPEKWPIITCCEDDYDILAVEWLWPKRIPMGMFTLLAGKPGTGKSTLGHNITTRMTMGTPWPDIPDVRTPMGSVMIIGEEDSVQHVTKPRLKMMGADMKKVHFWTEIGVRNGPNEKFSLREPLHIAMLEHLLKENPFMRLVIFDTLEPFMGKANTHRNSEVRQILDPLSALADRTGVAIIGITHLNKASKENRSALDRVMGSVGYTGAARVVWLLAKDEDDKDLIKMVLVKANVMGDPGGIAYKLQVVHTVDINGKDVETTIIGFQEGIIFEDADTVAQADGRARKVVDHVGDWLLKYLEKKPQLQSNILREGVKEGHSQATIYRRRVKLGVITFTTKVAGIQKPLVWWKLMDKMGKKE